MRKAFASLISSLSSTNKSSEETKASARTTSPGTQKENNKSQIITSNIKNNKSENPIKKNNYDIKPLNKIKKNKSNDLKKSTLKKSPPELKKLELTRKISSRTTSSTISKHSISNHRNKSSVIKNSDSSSDDEDENTSETTSDDEEEDDEDDHVPLGLRFQNPRSRSISSNYPPPSSQRDQEYYYDDTQIRNALHHNRTMVQDQNMERYHFHRNLSSPVPTTPPLIHTSRELLQSRFHERRFSSSASSSSSASVDSSGSRYYKRNNANIILNSGQRNRYSTWNEYEYDDYNPNGYYYDELYDDYDKSRISNGNLPSVPNTPTERMRRVSLNISSPRSRNSSFSKMYPGLTTRRRSSDSNKLVAGANPPPPHKYQKETTKSMSTSEYHRYQQEMVVSQYLKHGISPTIDDYVPEPLNNPRNPTLIQVQSTMVNVSSTRPKRLSVIDRGYSGSSYSSSRSNTPPAELARRTSYTRTISDYGSGAENSGISSHQRTHSESNAQINFRVSTRQHHHYNHNTPLYLQHQSHHSSSSSGSTYVSSNGPPTPTSRRSSMKLGSYVNGSRSSTPSPNVSGYVEKEKRRKSVLRE